MTKKKARGRTDREAQQARQNVSCCYRNSADEEKNGAASRYRNKAAWNNDVVAKVFLRFGFCRKICSEPDYAEAAKVFRKSADQNDKISQVYLGFMYYFGDGVSQSYEKAALWFKKSADQGDALSKICLGYMLSIGRGAAQNREKAEILYREAAACGTAEADVLLGDIYHFGVGVTPDYVYANKLYKYAAENDNVLGMYSLGKRYHENQNKVKAFGWYSKAAKKGYGPAYLQMGNLYSEGYSETLIPDKEMEAEYYRKAAEWYMERAKNGDLACQHQLADMSYEGRGIEENKSWAILLYQDAAIKGHADSQYALGRIYEDRNDLQEARTLFQEAAEQGHADSEYIVGCLLAEDNRMEDARTWFHKAADQGHALARLRLGAMAWMEHDESQRRISSSYGCEPCI